MWLLFNFLFRAVKLNLWFTFSAHNVMFTHQAMSVWAARCYMLCGLCVLHSWVTAEKASLAWKYNVYTVKACVENKNKCWMEIDQQQVWCHSWCFTVLSTRRRGMHSVLHTWWFILVGWLWNTWVVPQEGRLYCSVFSLSEFGGKTRYFVQDGVAK